MGGWSEGVCGGRGVWVCVGGEGVCVWVCEGVLVYILNKQSDHLKLNVLQSKIVLSYHNGWWRLARKCFLDCQPLALAYLKLDGK